MPVVGEQLRLKAFGVMRTSALNAVRDLQVDGLSALGAEQLLDHVLAIEKAMGALKLLLADRATESKRWRDRGFRSPEEDLAHRSGTSTGQAKQLLGASKQVKDQPVVADGLRDGQLSERQATVISDAATANPAAASKLVETATRNDFNGLRDACGRAKAAADPDPEATHRRLHAARRFAMGPTPEGMVSGRFDLTPAAAADFDASYRPFLEAEVRRAKRDRRNDTIEQLAADALVAMAHTTTTGTGSGPKSKSNKQMHVIVDHAALVRGYPEGEERCELSTSFGPLPVPVSVAQEILDDAFLTGIFTRGQDPQAVVTFGKHIPTAVREALRIRDDFTCAIDGCSRRASLEVDHHQPRHRNGPTAYTNLRHLCWHHHTQKTAHDRLFDTDPDPPDTG